MSEPVKIEYNADGEGHEYETHWFCEPVPPGVLFTIKRGEWDSQRKVHRIYEVNTEAGGDLP